ncbi:hypothetical protein AN964_16115 [Heyndrickxia shackletonii]|uniref:DUF2243 domain-containing protein n=1 Tax=Heyndrickxia shackletonii TaxID=157838 RepID=A0A0Q3WZP7_9BACI|nr:DUF2243 domain-containing protein [Heyndrickxia shackletonii]KQL54882.1 hypothetical protein AN964_16115 [Heyndrickxia shackletonii]NEY99460.1 DUF2243 domain-containing protein [Heyndrickxia shackletonii]
MSNRTFIGAFLFGMGIIGMLDGILLHQIFQFHSVYMYTNRFNQIVSDGLFHFFVTIIVFIGGYILWTSEKEKLNHPKLTFWAGFLLGGGIFNLVEGIIDHHLLGIHHVYYHTDNVLFYDLLYDGFSIVLIAAGAYAFLIAKRIVKKAKPVF